jgi:hypothetical protein
VADFCTLCSCTPRFQACRAAAAPKSQCPLVNCMQPLCCHDVSECTAAMLCQAPGESLGCGVCQQGSALCVADSDCPTWAICQPLPCACTPGATECVAGCPATPCAIGESCDFTAHRCHPLPCTSSNDCPRAFACAAGACARKTCSGDADCGSGAWCVKGSCYDSLGQCGYPPP